jgi:flagellar motor switch protein FliG
MAIMPRGADEYRKEQERAKRKAAASHGQTGSAKKPAPKKPAARPASRDKPRQDPAIRGFIKETARDAGYRKAAQFLMLLGKDEAARVLRHMAPEEVEGITREIARTQHIEEKEAAKILEEFGYIRETKDLIARGGIEKAQEMLTASVGSEKAEKILARVRKEMAPPPFTFLKDVDVHQAITLVREESVPVASLIIAHLEPKLAARILQALSPEIQKEIVPRIAKMQKVDPEVVRKTEEMLRSKVHESVEPDTTPVDGKTALTEILRYMDPGREQAILAELEPNMANQIRKGLVTMDVVFRLPDKDLQKVVRDYADRELALVLKGVPEMTRSRITSSMSERRRELVRLEEDAIGAVRRSDVDRAQQDFLEYIQLLEQKGEIVIIREREEYVE